MAYTAVLFDLDHTLLDSNSSEALAFDATMRSIGVENPGSHLSTYQRLNTALWKRVEQGELSPNEVKTLRFSQLLAELGIDADPTPVAEHYLIGLGSHGELFPGALHMLETVSSFARLALITNGIGSVQRHRIERLGLIEHFPTIAISGELGMSKPGAAIFEHIFAQIGPIDRATTVIVGDSLSSDIAGGHNAGIDTCWYNPVIASAQSIAPTFEVHSLDELPRALSQP